MVHSAGFNNPNTPAIPTVSVHAGGAPVQADPASVTALGTFLTLNAVTNPGTRFNAGDGDGDAVISGATPGSPVIFAYRAPTGKRATIHRLLLSMQATGLTMANFGGLTALTNGVLLAKTRLISAVHTSIYDILGGHPIRKNSDFARYRQGSSIIDPNGAGDDLLVFEVPIQDAYGVPLILDGSDPSNLATVWNEGVQLSIQDPFTAALNNLTIWLSGNIQDL